MNEVMNRAITRAATAFTMLCVVLAICAAVLTYLEATESATEENLSRRSVNEPPPAPILPMGRLGYPLGQYLTIEGVRADGFKTGTRTLLIDTVSGKKRPRPIELWIDNLKSDGLPSDERCIFKGYETGRMIGIPPSVAEAEALRSQAAWQFQHAFIVTTVVAPEGVEIVK